jgi:hypothetical protein
MCKVTLPALIWILIGWTTVGPSAQAVQPLRTLTADAYKQLREAAAEDETGQPLHPKVITTFGLAATMPIRVREIYTARSEGPNVTEWKSSMWFSVTTDDAFIVEVEKISGKVSIYHTDSSRVLQAAAVGSDVSTISLISNGQATDGFNVSLSVWASTAELMSKMKR